MLQIIRKAGLENIVDENEGLHVLIGGGMAEDNRDTVHSLANAISTRGIPTYKFQSLQRYPNDLYTIHEGFVIARSDFGDVANMGNYIFGDSFVLASASYQKTIESLRKDHPHFKNIFGKKEVEYITPYQKAIINELGEPMDNIRHLDLTLHYLAPLRLLTIDGAHYLQEKKRLDDLAHKHHFSIIQFPMDGQEAENTFPHNYLSLEKNGRLLLFLDDVNAPLPENPGYERILISGDKSNLQRYGGSLRCITHTSPTTKLWDALGILYTHFEKTL